MAQLQSDYYHVLGVTDKASLKEIKAAYRHLVRQYHPDVNTAASAKERFLKIQEAYQILSVLDKKAKYDQWLKSVRTAAASTKKNNGAAQKPATKTKPEQPARPSSSSDQIADPKTDPTATVMEQFMSIFKGQKEEPAAAKQSSKERPVSKEAPSPKGASPRPSNASVDSSQSMNGKPASNAQMYEATLVVLKQELEDGRVFRLPAKTNKSCQYCSSTGRINDRVCLICHGKKVQGITEEIDLRLPAEIANTGLYTLSCLKPTQSVVSLSLQIIPFTKGMTRRGLDIHYVFELSIPDWMLGGVFQVPGLRETETLNVTIPPCLSPEKSLRLQGKGIRMKSQQGDYFIQVTLKLPTGITSAERALYQELKALS